MKMKKEKKRKRESEDWCFECKDGGSLIICDRRGCRKVYHPSCVGKSDSDMQSGANWVCKRHSCYLCRKTPKFYCLCCPTVVCDSCTFAAEFAPVKGKKGLCSQCIELVLILEEQEEYHDPEVKLDLTDRNTFECLFFEYWEIIKDEEEVTLQDVYSADVRLKKGLSLKKKQDFEDRCFVCKDEGSLVFCNYGDCRKAYHCHCLGKSDSVTESGHWTCRCHSCYDCGKPPKYCCFLCPIAVCGSCDVATEFAPVKGNKGFCSKCLEQVLMLEGKWNKTDLIDSNTEEGRIFKYWNILKKEAGVTLEDIYSADTRLKKGLNSEDSDLDSEEYKIMGRRSKKPEFIGWGSKPLIEFLASLGVDTVTELSHIDVDAIIWSYIQEKKLIDPVKKKKVFCDEKLHSIFRRKWVIKSKIYSLLQTHFKDNFYSSEDDDEDNHYVFDKENNGSRDETENNPVKRKKQKKEGLDEKRQEEEKKPEVYTSCFISLVADNINLVYLRRSLVEELLKDEKTREYKIVGSFVKVKNDPRDYLQKNYHQLSLVTGINTSSTTGQMMNDAILQVSSFPFKVCISKLSDADITEEEIEDLREKVKNGLLKKPTIVEIEEKAKILHKDITKQAIARELSLLEGLIERMNLKGWRKELSEYLDRRELLQKPAEQERLLQQLPKVIPEVIEMKSDSTGCSGSSGQSIDGLLASSIEEGSEIK